MIKTTLSTLSLCLILSLNAFAQSTQDSTGLLGDNFSLEAALTVFKASESIEDFEKKLNEEDNYVNNLDLNEDGEIDFVKVNAFMEDDNHAIVLQVDLDKSESQDIAVIEIEKTGNESAILQIVGDEELYGPDKYVEPFELEVDDNGRGPSADNESYTRIVVNVWFWPSVRYIYRPSYRVYVSPWRWAYYPNYWKPWRPHPWRWHFNKRKHTHVHFHSVSVHRVSRVHKIYTPRRTVSKTVVHRNTTRTTVKRTTVAKSSKSTKVTKTAAASPTRKAAVKKTSTTKAAGNNKRAVKKTSTTKAKAGNKRAAKKTKTTVKKKKKKN